jgi:hypothetical protein
MRFAPILLLGAALAGCTTNPPVPTFDPYGAARLNALLAGKVAGAPSRCLPFRVSSVRFINSNTIAYEAGARLYVNRLQRNCGNFVGMNYSILTRPFGFGGPCSGDLVQVVDSSSGMMAGSCVLGDFVPYARR